jgi:four helix bundle protein
MIAKSLEDLQVFQQALEAADAVSALLDRSGFNREPELRDQIAECRSRIPALISEGFGQRSDRHCAHYQGLARGSCNEIRAHFAVACGKRILTIAERDSLSNRYVVIGKRLTRWIQHLERENRPRRG